MTSSLTSILSSYGYGTSATSTSSASAAITAAMEKLAAQDKTTKTTDTSSGTQVSISAEALAAAAAKADNEKDFSALAKEVRANLDSQYAAGTAKGKADLSSLSGRALAAIALDKDDQFSGAEQLAAKNALAAQTRTSFVEGMSQGGGLSALSNFSSALATQYDEMSPEEREARGWTQEFRDSNASFVEDAQSLPSLFDQLWADES